MFRMNAALTYFHLLCTVLRDMESGDALFRPLCNGGFSISYCTLHCIRHIVTIPHSKKENQGGWAAGATKPPPWYVTQEESSLCHQQLPRRSAFSSGPGLARSNVPSPYLESSS